MTESREARIEVLMTEGLNRYAMGDDARAMECWRKVLELDPQHAEALDYLRTAGGDSALPAAPAEPVAPVATAMPTTPVAAAAPTAAPARPRTLLEEALALLGEQRVEDGLELLETLVRTQPGHLEAHALIELARCELARRYRERLCDGIAVPQLKVSPREVARFNLPASANALLSAIDGTTSVGELLETSGLDPFEALRTCVRLLDAGIVEVHP